MMVARRSSRAFARALRRRAMTWNATDASTACGCAPVAVDRPSHATWWHVPVLLLLGLAFAVQIDAAPPLHGDAAMYAAIGKAVAQTGEVTRLTFNGRPYLNKPPLFFWLVARAHDATGSADVAARLVSGLLGVANVLLLYLICRGTGFDPTTAFAASLVYVTTPEVVHWTRGVHLESLLTLWLLVGLLAARLSLDRPAAILLLGVAVAGGWMSKGPQALFAVAVAPVLWWQAGVLRERVRSRWSVAAAVIVVAVIAPFTLSRLGDGSGYAETYFRQQIGGVLLAEPGAKPRHPLWYVGKLLASYWPWLPFAVAGIWTLGRRWRSDANARTWLAYGALVLLVTSAAAARRPRYLTPLYPMLAVAAAVPLGALARRHLRLLPSLVGIALLAGLVVAVAGREKSSAASDRMRADAVEIARALPQDADVWLASDVPQEGMPGIAKVLGAYAAPLLCACAAPCQSAAPRGELHVVVLAGSADALAGRIDATVQRRNDTLAILRVADGARDAVRTHACALDEVIPAW
jgi:4-amino-4-deoxy-L-arabinose transferase-like glycosyltransferase